MALITVSDIQTEVLVRNNRSTTDSFITDTILDDWTRQAHTWAAARHKWPCTEGRVSTTYTSTADENGDIVFNYPEGWKSDSIRYLMVGGKKFKKTNFYIFRKFREDQPNDGTKLFADYNRQYYLNPNSQVSGTVMVFGQYTPNIDPTDKTAVTVFSYFNDDGNEAIVEKMTSYLKRREHIPQESELHDQRASAKLDDIWKNIQEEQYGYESNQSEGMFERIDVVEGEMRDNLIHRDRFY